MFVDSFHMYLKYGTRVEFVIDLDDVYLWLGFTRRDNAKVTVQKNLEVGVHYEVHEELLQESSTLLRTKETILLTVRGFKQLCLTSKTERARSIREYYLSMEEVLMEHTMLSLEQQKIQYDAALSLVDEQKSLLLLQAEELERTRVQVYQEIPKPDNVYMFKEIAELHTDTHKIGKALDPKKRLKELNTGSAQGIIEILRWPTSNAKIIEDMLKVSLKRNHISSEGGLEHYQQLLDHSARSIVHFSVTMDTASSTSQHASHEEYWVKAHEGLDRAEESSRPDGDLFQNMHRMHDRFRSPPSDGEESEDEPLAVPDLVMSPLEEFLNQSDAQRGCSISWVAAHITTLSQFNRVFSPNTVGTKATRVDDTEVFMRYGFEMPKKRFPNLCAGCHQASHVNCCPEYNMRARETHPVILNMMLGPAVIPPDVSGTDFRGSGSTVLDAFFPKQVKKVPCHVDRVEYTMSTI